MRGQKKIWRGGELEDRLRKMRLRWFGHVKHRDENSILRKVMELEVEGRRPGASNPRSGKLGTINEDDDDDNDDLPM